MPSGYLRKYLDLHHRKNQLVFENIARLHDIAQHGQSQQHILDQLHPWQASRSLQFDQKFSYILAAGAASQYLLFLWWCEHGWAQIFFGSFAICAFFSYCYYESSQPIKEIIQKLESQVIAHKYQLEHKRFPTTWGENHQKVLFIAQLKQKFPLFNQGNASNQFTFYTSTRWHNEQGRAYDVMIFQYQFSHQSSPDQPFSLFNIKAKTNDLWGIFIFDFDLPLCTLACTTSNQRPPYPYHLSWQTSDIQTNQKINIYGQDQLDMVKCLTPVFTLKLNQFFAQREGDLWINTQHQMLCFLSDVPLMQIESQYPVMHDISSLRGHLRTLKLKHLEQLKADVLQLIN